MPDSLRERRALLRKKIEEISPDAISVVNEILNDPKAEYRDKLRAAEIALTHSLPRQEEVDINESNNVFSKVEPSELPKLLEYIDLEVVNRQADDSSGDRPSA